MFRIHLIALCGCLPVLAQVPNSISLAPNQYLSYPISSNWTDASWRYEFRVHNFSTPAQDTYYFTSSNGYYCRVSASSTSLACFDGPDSKIVSVSLGSATDFRATVGRDLTNQLWTLWIWDGQGNPIGHQSATLSRAGTNAGGSGSVSLIVHDPFSFGAIGGDLAFFRWYSSAPPLAPGPPAEAPAVAGDRGDFRMENTVNDSGPAGLHLTLNGGGSPTYVSSPIYPPVAAINTIPSARAAFPVSLTSSSFTSLLGNGVPALLWQQRDGPVIGPFSNQTTLASTFTPPLAGSYQIQLTATDALAQSSTVTATLGAVATDANGVVITGNPTLDRLMGPVTRAGTSPWPYYDVGEQEISDTIIAAALANPPTLGATLSGTCQLTNAYEGCVGTGSHYTSEIDTSKYYIIAWNTADGVGTGRLQCNPPLTVTDDTHFHCAQYAISSITPLDAGLTVYNYPAITSTFSPAWWGMNPGAGTNSWNYYDVTLALYRHYYRTGLTKYLTAAQQFADYWWQWGIDHGSGVNVGNVPRAAALQSQFIRAMELSSPVRYAALYAMITYWQTQADFSVGQDCGGVPKCDQREAGYNRWFTALGAMVDPDTTHRAQYCSWLATSTPAWINNQLPAGNWNENDFLWNFGFAQKGPGMSPWRMDITIAGHQAVYDVLNDTSSSGCNNPALAAQLYPAIQHAVDYVWEHGRSTVNRGIWYDADYETADLNTTIPAGTVSVARGSTTVTGVGTNFPTAFAPCDGSTYIGFDQGRTIYQVTGCGPTSLIIAQSYGSQREVSDVSASAYAEVPKSYTTCGGGTATYCNAYGGGTPPNGDRNLTRFPPGMTGWMYLRSGDPKYLAWGDEWFSAAFGGPADGPSGVLPCAGPACDGIQTDWATDVFSGNTAFSNLGKDFGEGSGAPAAQTYLAARFGGPAPLQPISVNVSLPLATYPGVTQMYVFVIQPNGLYNLTVCSASPCQVQVDPRLGNHLMQVAYFGATGEMLSVSDLTVLTVP